MKTYSHAVVGVPVDGRLLPGELTVPDKAAGVVTFAHIGGQRRPHGRSLFPIGELQEAGFATLLVDLLDQYEGHDRHNIFDVELAGDRLLSVTRWLAEYPLVRSLPRGYFGAGTGSAAALIAAARDPKAVSAVVCRSGQAHMALSYLHQLTVPTLLIVGELDDSVLNSNREACRHLRIEKELVVVPRATHLFTETGTMEEAALHARRWFIRHLSAAGIPGATAAAQGSRNCEVAREHPPIRVASCTGRRIVPGGGRNR